MQLYSSLADYIESNPCQEHCPELKGSDRPFLVLGFDEKFHQESPFLIQWDENIYEIGFPWVQISDWEHHGNFSQKICVQLEDGDVLKFILFDEILDETQISNNEAKLQHLKEDIGNQFERTTADTIAILIGLFDALLGKNKRRSENNCYLIDFLDILTNISQEEAHLPLVLALDKRYELRHKLELITPKLRSQLNRNAEMIPLGQIQEMDAYCLRDYVRRPGHNAVEKAGDRQELMGIKRYQNFNTAENRFLRGFCDRLHLECLEYKQYPQAERLSQAIDRFRQDPSVQTIPKTHNFVTKPNYVLQQNPIYRSFYQAYLDYVKRRTEKEKIWGFRQALLVDTIAVLLMAALLNIEGSYTDPNSSITVSSVPHCGQYLKLDLFANIFPKIYCILQTKAFIFEISKSMNPDQGDLQISLNVQSLRNNNLNQEYRFSIWIFWYKPTNRILESIQTSTSVNSIYIYLHENPSLEQHQHNENLFNILRIPSLINEDFNKVTDFLSHNLCELFTPYLGN